MAVRYKWATLGVGVIGHELAEAMKQLGGNLYSVGNRTHEKAVKFASDFGIGKIYDKPDDIFEDPDVDIVYISTPHNTHIEYLRKALNAGKHVLCEKSITLNSDELSEAVGLAEKNHVVLAEAMTLYHMPVYKKLNEIIESGKLGELRLIQMNFGSYKEYNMANRFFNKNLAGGAMLDIGVYALSCVRWFMNETPDQITSQVKYAPTGVDEQASILLMNPKGEMATVIISLHAKQPKRATISFDKAYVEIFNYPRADKAFITYTDDGHTEEIDLGDTASALSYEVTDMEKAVNLMKQSGGTLSPFSPEIDEITHLTYTEDVMRIMTKCRNDWGMKYPEELG